MRTIKFRGRALTLDKRWVIGSYVTRLNSRGGREHLIVRDGGIEYAVDDNTLGQFTGLHDKNGKEIYEGDILSCEGGQEIMEGSIEDCEDFRVVEWSDNLQWIVFCKFCRDSIPLYEFSYEEIIGNIYENPELLTPPTP